MDESELLPRVPKRKELYVPKELCIPKLPLFTDGATSEAMLLPLPIPKKVTFTTALSESKFDKDKPRKQIGINTVVNRKPSIPTFAKSKQSESSVVRTRQLETRSDGEQISASRKGQQSDIATGVRSKQSKSDGEVIVYDHSRQRRSCYQLHHAQRSRRELPTVFSGKTAVKSGPSGKCQMSSLGCRPKSESSVLRKDDNERNFKFAKPEFNSTLQIAKEMNQRSGKTKRKDAEQIKKLAEELKSLTTKPSPLNIPPDEQLYIDLIPIEPTTSELQKMNHLPKKSFAPRTPDPQPNIMDIFNKFGPKIKEYCILDFDLPPITAEKFCVPDDYMYEQYKQLRRWEGYS